MKLKYFNLLILFAIIILVDLSFIFGKLLLPLFSIPVLLVAGIIATIGHTRYNKKIFYSAEIITIILTTIYLGRNLTLTDIPSVIFSIAGALLIVIAFDKFFTVVILRRKSLYLLGKNKFQESLDNSNKILNEYNDDYGAFLFKAMALEKLGRYEEQLEVTNKLIEKRHGKWFNSSKLNDVELSELNLKIDALIHLKRLDEASDLIEATLKKKLKTKYANQGPVLFFKAKLLSELGNYQEAIPYYEKSLSLINESIENSKKSLDYKLNKTDELISLDQGLDENWVDKGKAHEKLQQYKEALDSYDNALSINPESEEALRRKDDVLEIISGKDVVSS